MLIYFAHPIDQTKFATTVAVDEITNLLKLVGLSVYRPGGAFTIADAPLSDLALVQRINEFSQYAADALVAWLPTGVATLGVPAEIEKSLAAGKPTLILVEGGLFSRSVQLRAWRDMGAAVETWNHETARRWSNRPVELVDLLRTPPVREVIDASTFGETATVPGRTIEPGSEDLLVRYDHPDHPTLVPGKYEGDAGVDLAIKTTAMLDPGEYKLISTGAHVAIPDGYFGLITGRSSTWAKYRCQVVQAVIDSGYRGELMIGITNLNADRLVFEAGMRLAQIILLPTFGGKLKLVDRLPDSHRGLAGYGSSGA